MLSMERLVLMLVLMLMCSTPQRVSGDAQDAYFLPEFALSPQGSFLEETVGEQYLTYRHDDQSARVTRWDEEDDTGWDAWGSWSDCSRTCGGGASYSLRRCLNGGNCEGRNIRYRTCSNTDCPPESGDFRAQQCSAHNDIKYHGQTHEWIPVSSEAVSPCALRCQAKGNSLVLELAPKVLDGTRCKDQSLDMCISGVCQEVGCDRQLGSSAKEDNCGVCAGDGSTCRLVRGQALPHVSPQEPVKMLMEVPVGSRSLRITAKGPGTIVMEAQSSPREELVFISSGSYSLRNNTVEFQRGAERQTLRSHGPLTTDFSIKVKYGGPKDTVMQFMFYQPIRYQWRETDFFPCSVSCGGGYQLNSADCVDIRQNKTVAEHLCHAYPENTKPTPKLKECGMELCPDSDGFKEVMPYDHFQPLPRWEQNPWTSCSVSCGGGTQERSVVCVEEDVHGQVEQVEEWKCTHSQRPISTQSCNAFECPQWTAMEWSQCTVSCGPGLRYRVVLCVDHQGQQTGGCSSAHKPQVKEDCLRPIACHKPKENQPVEDKLPWIKQAQELEETRVALEDPTFIPGPWSACSVSCGLGVQKRVVKCKVLLSFTQTEVDLPDEECDEAKPSSHRSCDSGSCSASPSPEPHQVPKHTDFAWEYKGFSPCSASCGVGRQTALITCVNTLSKEAVDDSHCTGSSSQLSRFCNAQHCPARFEVSTWNPCSVSCGVGLQTRSVTCVRTVEGNHTEAVPSKDCVGVPPQELRACNQVTCPPSWETEDWQKCSASCGRGRQWREVSCQQRLSSGSRRRLRDQECPAPKPAVQRSCITSHCLRPRLEGGDWSTCSVTCGRGLQRREPVCKRQTASGQMVTLERSSCRHLPLPPLVRSCRMSSCKNHKHSRKRCPQVIGLKHIYIQTRPEKRLRLTIGGRAYLLPKTSVIIRCPVRHFPKAQIRWEKDGRLLNRSKHVSITKSGALRVYSLDAGDIGLYRCWANQDSDTFSLKLIGYNNRLLERPEGAGLSNQKNFHVYLNKDQSAVKCQEYKGPSQKKAQHSGSSWVHGNEFYRDDDNYSQELWNTLSFENYALASGAVGHTGTFVLEPEQFEELVKNITQLVESGEVTEEMASQVIGKLMEDLATAEGGTRNEENLKQSGGNTSEVKKGSRALILRQKPHGSAMSFKRDLRVSIGTDAYLTNATHSLTLLCPTQGQPPPDLSWSKDGAPLLRDERVWWDGGGELHVSGPGARDVGIYTCTAANGFGSDSERTSVFLAESPSISAWRRNTTAVGSASVSVLVGGFITAAVGANVTLKCPVRGVPPPTVSWHHREGPLGSSARLLHNGSLLLTGLSLRDFGSYSCVAANAVGKSVATSLLHVEGGILGKSQQQPWTEMKRKRVIMASLSGTSVTVKPGDVLRIGCPVLPSHRKPVKWSHQNQTLRPGAGMRALAGGRVLEVDPTAAFDGRYECETHTEQQQRVTAWIHVSSEEFEWRLGEWSECSTSCGGGGAQRRAVLCLTPQGREMPPYVCHHLPKPVGQSRACNPTHCPPSGVRWVSSAWSGCSSSCGPGFRQRRVSCHQLEASGSERSVPPSACDGSVRPEDREECVSQACVEWLTGPWGKCSGGCLGPGVATQTRSVSCRHRGNSTSHSCHPEERPASSRNCSSEACDVQWKAWPWRPCTVACGRGFQSRRVECVRRVSGAVVPDIICTWQRRPETWQHCNITSCGGECRDRSHYCPVVKRLRLCRLDLYRQLCCQSCSHHSSAT